MAPGPLGRYNQTFTVMQAPVHVRVRPAILLFILAALGYAAGAFAQGRPATPASGSAVPAPAPTVIEGKVSFQGTIPLGGAVVALSDGKVEVDRLFSDADGGFRFEVKPGRYQVMVSILGFDPMTTPVTVAAGATVMLPVDLAIARVAESVDVVATEPVVAESGTLASSDTVKGNELEEINPGGGLQAALRLLVGVIQVPGGLSIKGGRPSQASVQLGPGIFVDPATGLTQGSLPGDAIEAVTVMPNPYAVEFGRFSSGVVLIQTRRAADKWKTRLNSLDPAFRNKRGQPLTVPMIRLLQRALETLPPDANLYLLGAVTNRPTDTIRICISGLKHENLLNYLAALDWPGLRDELAALLKTCADLFDRDRVVLLHLDLSTTLKPKIGLELYLPKNRRGQPRSNWPKVFDQLVAHSWCTSAKCAGLLKWIGGVELPPDPSILPAERPQFLVRRINHLKLVHEPGLPVQAKAYVVLLTISRSLNANPAQNG